MRKTFHYGWKALLLAYRANGIYAPLTVVSKVYESTLYPFIQIVLLAKALDFIGKYHSLAFSRFIFLILSYLSASVLKITLTTFLDVRGAYMDIQVEAYVDLLISKKLSELDPATFENSKFQSLLTQIEGVKGTLQMHIIRFTGLINFAIQFVIAAVVVSVTFPLSVPLLIIATIPSFVIWDKARKKTWPYYVEKRSVVTRVTQYIKNLLSSDSTSKEVNVFHTGELLIEKIKTHQDHYFHSFARVNDPWIYKILLARIIQLSAFVFTQYLNLSLVLRGAVGIGQFALFFQQTVTLAQASEEILNQYSSISARTKYLDKFFEFLSTEKKIHSPPVAVALPLHQIPPLIEFKNVTFRYPKTTRDILRNFSLTIRSGEKIALVGENGAGKTTIIKLLLRFYDVSEGKLCINGVNIKELRLAEWYEQVGALFQDFIKYQFTFKENVYFGNLAAKDNMELLKSAIEKSGAESYLKDLPKELDQIVGKMFDEGVDLSGGQWQKLALARAFFRDAPVLILDEPTAAIDAKAEYEIFEKVQNLQKDKTVIIISHRFSTVRNADRILVLDEGNIVEEGSHKRLMRQRGLYAELFELQAKGYK